MAQWASTERALEELLALPFLIESGMSTEADAARRAGARLCDMSVLARDSRFGPPGAGLLRCESTVEMSGLRTSACRPCRRRRCRSGSH